MVVEAQCRFVELGIRKSALYKPNYTWRNLKPSYTKFVEVINFLHFVIGEPNDKILNPISIFPTGSIVFHNTEGASTD